MRVQPRPRVGVLVFLIYLAAFYGVWVVTGVDYSTIGDSADTLLKWYVAPLAAGGLVLVVAATVLGWWRPALWESGRRAPAWTLVTPAAMALLGVVVLASKSYDESAAVWVLLVLGSIGVGFGEEMATRGLLLVGLRGALAEPQVWFLSTLAFGLLHLPNWGFGEGPGAVAQVLLAFCSGSTMYLLRRGSGSLVPCMALHGFWDFTTFAGHGATLAGLLNIPLGVASVVVVLVLLRRERGVRLAPYGLPRRPPAPRPAG